MQVKQKLTILFENKVQPNFWKIYSGLNSISKVFRKSYWRNKRKRKGEDLDTVFDEVKLKIKAVPQKLTCKT